MKRFYPCFFVLLLCQVGSVVCEAGLFSRRSDATKQQNPNVQEEAEAEDFLSAPYASPVPVPRSTEMRYVPLPPAPPPPLAPVQRRTIIIEPTPVTPAPPPPPIAAPKPAPPVVVTPETSAKPETFLSPAFASSTVTEVVPPPAKTPPKETAAPKIAVELPSTPDKIAPPVEANPTNTKPDDETTLPPVFATPKNSEIGNLEDWLPPTAEKAPVAKQPKEKATPEPVPTPEPASPPAAEPATPTNAVAKVDITPEPNAPLLNEQHVDREKVAREELQATVATMLIPYKKRRAGGSTSGDLVGSAESKEIYEAMELLLDEEFDEALPILEKAFRNNPANVGVWSSLGWAYWVLDRQDEALHLWTTMRNLDPDHFLPYSLIGTAFYSLKEIDKAEENFLRSLELKPDQFNLRLRLGVMYRWHARYSESVAMLEKLYYEDTDRLDVANELALAYFYDEQYEKALPFMPRARQANPNNDAYGIAHAKCLLTTGSTDEAVKLMEDLLTKDPDNLSLLILRTEAPSTPENRTMLINFLMRARKLSDNPDQRRMLANRLFDIYRKSYEDTKNPDDLDEPVDLLEDLVDEEPDNVEAHLLLAEMSLMRRELERAIRLFTHVLDDFNPNNIRALIGLGEAHQLAGNGPKSGRFLERVEALNKHDPYYQDRMARYNVSRFNTPEAYERIDELERSGFGGAVPILMYSELSLSNWSDKMALKRFTEHMAALKREGYRFITLDEIPEYLAQREASISPLLMRDALRIHDKVVAVCFDLPFKNTLEMADVVALERDLVFSAFVPVRSTRQGKFSVHRLVHRPTVYRNRPLEFW